MGIVEHCDVWWEVACDAPGCTGSYSGDVGETYEEVLQWAVDHGGWTPLGDGRHLCPRHLAHPAPNLMDALRAALPRDSEGPSKS